MITRRKFLIGALATPALVRASSLDFIPRAAAPSLILPPPLIFTNNPGRPFIHDQFIDAQAFGFGPGVGIRRGGSLLVKRVDLPKFYAYRD